MSSPSTAGCRSPSPTDHQRRSAGSPTRASLRAQSAGCSSGGRRWAQPAAPTAAVGTQWHFILTALPVPPGPDPPRSAPQPPSMGRPRLSVTFLKPGQVEGAGDVDGGAGAAVWPAGVHVKRAVAEEPLGGRGEADGRMPAARTPPVPRTRLSDPQPSSCDATTRSGPAGSRTRGVGLARHPPQALVPVPHPLLEGPLQHLGPAVLQRRAAQRDIPRVPLPPSLPLRAPRPPLTGTAEKRHIHARCTTYPGPGASRMAVPGPAAPLPAVGPAAAPGRFPAGPRHLGEPPSHRAPLSRGVGGGAGARPGATGVRSPPPRALPPIRALRRPASPWPSLPAAALPDSQYLRGVPIAPHPPFSARLPPPPAVPLPYAAAPQPGAQRRERGSERAANAAPPLPTNAEPRRGGGRGVAPPPGAQSGPPHRERGPGGRGGNAQG